MIPKALTYCLQEEQPVPFTEFMNIFLQKKEKINLECHFITPSNLKRMICEYKKQGKSVSQYKIRPKITPIKSLNQTSYYLNNRLEQSFQYRNRAKSFRISPQKNNSKIKTEEQIAKTLSFNLKQRKFKSKADIEYFHLEDKF